MPGVWIFEEESKWSIQAPKHPPELNKLIYKQAPVTAYNTKLKEIQK